MGRTWLINPKIKKQKKHLKLKELNRKKCSICIKRRISKYHHFYCDVCWKKYKYPLKFEKK